MSLVVYPQGVDGNNIKYLAHHLLDLHSKQPFPYLDIWLTPYPARHRMRVLCDALWSMNIQSMGRCGKTAAEQHYGNWTKQARLTRNYRVPDYNQLQFYQSLLYYLDRTDSVPTEHRKLYNFMRKLSYFLAYQLVRELPDYNKAVYGTPSSK